MAADRTTPAFDVVKRAVLRSPAARVAALPTRLRLAGRHVWGEVRLSARWIVRSREHTNFTYDLHPLSRAYLEWFISDVVDVPVAEVRAYMDELQDDRALARHISAATMASGRRWLADDDVRYGRRLGWYALVRATRPEVVVETGTDKGLGSCVIAAALLRNGKGRLITIDTNPDAGYLIAPPYDTVVDRRLGDSVDVLGRVDAQIDLFLHDSLHTKGHELAELGAAKLGPRSLVLSDNAHATDALASWAERTGRRFAFFDERPVDHWHPGAGIGIAWHPHTDPGRRDG